MSLLEKATLLLTPNAFKGGKGYSVIGPNDFAVLRNTAATRVNSERLIASQGSNIMRVDYSSGTPMILDELQSTLLNSFSGDIITGFANISSTSALVSQTNPFGAANSVLITELGNGPKYINSTGVSFINGTNYSISFIVKKGNGVNAPDFVQITTGIAVAGNVFANFNISNGTVAFSQGGTGSIKDLQNGFFKISFSFTATANSSSNGFLLFCNNVFNNGRFTPYTAQSDSNVFCVYGGVEQSLLPSSEIITGNAAVTRNDDLITVNPPPGTIKITTLFEDNTIQTLTTIPTTFTLPTGRIKYVLMQHTL
jgi:hypothetical protein